jgi:DNA-binding response OmpR family regulator
VDALSAGADDFMLKPASREVLLARIKAAYRRVSPQGLLVFRLGPYEVDVSRHQISVDGVPLAMTLKEFEMATYFLQNPGRLFSRDHLLNKVWGVDVLLESRTVDTHASRLRKKLKMDGSTGWRLTSVYGYGYRLTSSDAAD